MCIVSCHVCWRNLSASCKSWNCKSLPTSSPKPASHGSLDSQSTPGAIILSITYGIDIKSVDDRFLNANLEASHAIAAAMVPGKFLADVIPMCACLCAQIVTHKPLTDPLIVRHIPDWFPGTGFKALAKEARDKFRISVDGPFEYVKNAMKVCPRSSPSSNCVLNPSITTSLARGFPSL